MGAVTPFVYWAQDVNNIFLRIDISDVENPQVDFKPRLVTFLGTATSGQGKRDYAFQLDLHADIEVQKEVNEVKVSPRNVNLIMLKKNMGYWSRLTAANKPHWLRVDFDKFKNSDSESEHDNEWNKSALSNIPNENRMVETEMDRITKEILGDKYKNGGTNAMTMEQATAYAKKLRSNYLVVYNCAMFGAHLILFLHLLYGYVSNGSVFLTNFWKSIILRVGIFTALQYMDVLHSLIGLTKTNYKAAIIQVTGRMFILFLINGCPHLHIAFSSYLLLVVYIVIEIFRYPYYALNVKEISNNIATWLRYTMWIPLYPLGMTLEGITMLRCIICYYYSGAYSLQMPNCANISINFGIFVAFVLIIIFPPTVYFLLLHMKAQRARKLVDKSKKKTL